MKRSRHYLSSNPATYRIFCCWSAMLERCYNKSHKYYSVYGGRGIKVHPHWIVYPEAFVSWALSSGYRDDLSIDRIDNDKNYTPENCRWIPRKLNSKRTNARRVRRSDGKMYESAADAAKDLHLNRCAVSVAIQKGRKVSKTYTFEYV